MALKHPKINQSIFIHFNEAPFVKVKQYINAITKMELNIYLSVYTKYSMRNTKLTPVAKANGKSKNWKKSLSSCFGIYISLFYTRYFRECRMPCMLNTYFVDFGKDFNLFLYVELGNLSCLFIPITFLIRVIFLCLSLSLSKIRVIFLCFSLNLSKIRVIFLSLGFILSTLELSIFVSV
jgi:hypothetical protein